MKTFSGLFLLLWAGGAALGQAPKVAPDLANADSQSTVHAIVQFDHDPTDADHQKVISRGGTWRGTLHSIQSGAYSLPAGAIADLANDANVVHISVDHKVWAKNDYSTAATNATQAWQQFGVNGSGIGIALIDSGVAPHPDLAGSGQKQRVVYSEDFLGGDGWDHYGHGEHVAGTIAGSGLDTDCSSCTRNLKGMASGANLINLRVLDQNGEGQESTIIAAIERAIALKKKYNVRVINLSLGVRYLKAIEWIRCARQWKRRGGPASW